MISAAERSQFLQTGFLHVPGLLSPAHLQVLRAEFERIWCLEGPPVSRSKLLKYPVFIELIEHGAILERQRALFGQQTQLLQYDLLRQQARSDFPVRFWHRDFVFPGDRPLAVNTIVYLDEMTPERGPTYVVPGSHWGSELPPRDRLGEPLPGEVAVLAAPGDAVFINGAIWHSGSRNGTDELRRAIYLYYGYWWLKRYNEHEPLPAQALIHAAGPQRLSLLGINMPEYDLHMYGQPRREEVTKPPQQAESPAIP